MSNPADVKQHNSGPGAIQNTGDFALIVQIEKLLVALSESTLQSNFYTATGIRCGRSARVQLEALLEKDFDGYALGMAWARRVLRWNAKAKSLEVKIGLPEYLSLVSLLVIYAAAATLTIQLTRPYELLNMTFPNFCIFGGMVMFGLFFGIAIHRLIWQPIATAKAVRVALN